MSPTTIYLAARYSRREELCGYRGDLEARGFKVPARWLLGCHQITDAGLALGPERQDDDDDVTGADLLIAFTERPRSDKGRGGRHVKLGIALGRGIPVIVVGPQENIFCCLPQVTVYPDWPAALTDPRLDHPFELQGAGEVAS